MPRSSAPTARERVTHALIAKRWADGAPSAGELIACDCVAMSGGWTANVALHAQAHGPRRVRRDGARLPAGEPGRGPPLGRRLPRRFHPGGRARRRVRRRRRGGRPGAAAAAAGRRRASASGGPLALVVGGAAKRPNKAFVDFHNDVTARESDAGDTRGHAFDRAHQALHHRRHGPDQGKATNLNALAVVAAALGKPIAEVGLPTFRPPFAPVSFGALAGLARGELFEPVRETPLHGWAARRAPCSRTPGSGSAPRGSRCRARRRPRRSSANAWRRAPPPASRTLRRSARSRSSAPTRSFSSSGSMSTPSPSSRSAAAAMR